MIPKCKNFFLHSVNTYDTIPERVKHRDARRAVS